MAEVTNLAQYRADKERRSAEVTKLNAKSQPGKARKQEAALKEVMQNPAAAFVEAFMNSVELKQKLERLGVRNERKVQELRRLVGTYDNDQIARMVRSATDADLQQKPAFYHALLDEAHARALDLK